MTGIVFPDIGRTLLPLIAAERADERAERQNALLMERQDRTLDWHREESKRNQSNADREFELKLRTHVAGLDDKARARLKDDAEWTANTIGGFLALPEADQPAAYNAIMARAAAEGRKINMPPTWSPSLKPQIQAYAVQSKAYRDALIDHPQPQPMPGGAPAPGGGRGDYYSTVGAVESGGKMIPNASGSGAFGPYQFMPGSWATVAKANPGLNLPPDMRQASPEQHRAAVEAFTRANAEALRAAGIEPTAANLYLAHALGAGGAKTVLGASPDTPLPTILPKEWLPQNPQLNTTAGQYLGGINQRFGGVASPFGGQPQPQVAGMPAQGDNPVQLAQAQGQDAQPSMGFPTVDGSVVDADVLKQIKMPPGAAISLRGGKITKLGEDLIEVVYPNRTLGYVRIPPKPNQGPQGPFGGTALDAQMMNILLYSGDPASQAYANAFAHVSRPLQSFDENTGKLVMMPPRDMSMFAPPTFRQQVGQTTAPSGPTVQQIAEPKKTEAFRKLETEALAVDAAIENFLNVITEAGGGTFNAFINNPQSAEAQKILGAHNAMKTALRSEAFVNTGVLQPMEMTMIDNMLLAPTTIRGALATPEAYRAMLGEIQRFVHQKIDAAYQAAGITKPARGGTQQPGGPQVKPGTTGADGPRLSPEEAAKLPPGTPFIGQDGVPRVRN